MKERFHASEGLYIYLLFIVQQSEEQLLELFRSTVRGPFSLIYFNATFNSLYIARDSLGRQSLLFGRISGADGHQAHTIISSVADRRMVDTDHLLELPPLGLFKLSLELGSWSLHPWQSLQADPLYAQQLAEMSEKFGICITVEDDAVRPEWLNGYDEGSMETPAWSFEALINALFSNAPEENTKKPADIFSGLLAHQSVASTVDELLQLLSQSVRERCEATPQRCRNCMLVYDYDLATTATCHHCRIGILFSGGLDCTVLAVLADRWVPAECPIDLLNVSFEKVRARLASKDGNVVEINYDTPDRLTARESLLELRTLRPERLHR